MSLPLDDLCLAVRDEHRRRVFWMEQRKRSYLALGAYLRLSLGWERDAPLSERNEIARRATAMIAYGEAVFAGKEVGAPPDDYIAFAEDIVAGLAALEPALKREAGAAKEMERLAQTLPVWPWAEQVRGLGPRSLAVIVGDATSDGAPTLGEYRTKGGLWKRMGIATIDGIAQGKLLKTAPAATWVAHGYSASRRSRMWVIGDSLIKNNRDGRYRTLYLARKELERQRAAAAGFTVAPAAKIPAKRRAEFISDGHIHARAQRVMEQQLLHDLWREWRRTYREAVQRAT